MRIAFFGTPEFALPSLRAILRSGHEIGVVITRPDRPRHRQSSPPEPSPVSAEAQRAGLLVLSPSLIGDPDFCARLAARAPEVIVVVAYGRILPRSVLMIPPRGSINLHASLLPKYRGAAPVARAIMAGERITGVSTMRMDEGLDTGDILLQQDCAIGLEETAGELGRRLADIGAELLVRTLDLLARGALAPRMQDDEEATQAPALTRNDGRIEWSRDSLDIVNQVRGCHPWPLAFSALRGTRVAIHRAEVSLEPMDPAAPPPSPGQVIAAHQTIVVQCLGDSRLRILQLQFPGRKVMTAREAINGRLIRSGDVFVQAPTIR